MKELSISRTLFSRRKAAAAAFAGLISVSLGAAAGNRISGIDQFFSSFERLAATGASAKELVDYSYAPDAVIVPEGEAVIRGRDNFVEKMVGYLKNGARACKYHITSETLVHPDTVAVTAHPTCPGVTFSIRALYVFQKLNGHWKITVETYDRGEHRG